MLRIVIIGVLIIFVVAVGFQVSILFKEESRLKGELNQLKDKTNSFNKENGELEAQVNFLSRLENLSKELKSKFNYKKIGEKMMILVP